MLLGIGDEFWIPGISLFEKILRPVLVYVFLVAAFRLFGKRQLGQLTPSDLIVLLIISNVVQNAMIGPDDSLTGGLIGGVAIFGMSYAYAKLTFRFPRLARLIEGQPTTLIENGKLLTKNLERELVTKADLEQALRKHSIELERDLPTLEKVEIDPEGQIIVRRIQRFLREDD